MQTELKEKINFLIETSQIGVSKDFTAEEKKLVFDHFENFGLTPAPCRNRFFRDGWHQWELDGIIQCLIDYAEEHPEVQGFAEECRKKGVPLWFASKNVTSTQVGWTFVILVAFVLLLSVSHPVHRLCLLLIHLRQAPLPRFHGGSRLLTHLVRQPLQ